MPTPRKRCEPIVHATLKVWPVWVTVTVPV
jgi:hypothetical protein